MHRDLDLIRTILLELEQHDLGLPMRDLRVQAPGYTHDQISYHVKILAEAGYVERHQLFLAVWDEVAADIADVGRT